MFKVVPSCDFVVSPPSQVCCLDQPCPLALDIFAWGSRSWVVFESCFAEDAEREAEWGDSKYSQETALWNRSCKCSFRFLLISPEKNEQPLDRMNDSN